MCTVALTQTCQEHECAGTAVLHLIAGIIWPKTALQIGVVFQLGQLRAKDLLGHETCLDSHLLCPC